MKLSTGLAAVLVALAASSPSAQTAPVLAQQPVLSATQVVFVFAGDLWSVPRAGGEARRLTAGAGVESNPTFSPNGEWIAFHRAIRREHRRLRHAGAGRRAETAHVAPRC